MYKIKQIKIILAIIIILIGNYYLGYFATTEYNIFVPSVQIVYCRILIGSIILSISVMIITTLYEFLNKFFD